MMKSLKIYLNRGKIFHIKEATEKVTIVGGSYGKMGAAVLATKSVLKTGAGLTFTLAPKCGYEILQTSCPEAMFIEGGIDYINDFTIDENSSCGVSSGLGTEAENCEKFPKIFKKLLKTYGH
ncbi:hypothetical protein [Chryseobacterium wanjuense]